MKIAISSKGMNLDAEIDPRFGRAAYIPIIDPDTMTFDVLDNKENINTFKGAGIQAASNVNEKGASALITGYCGPNAFKTLDVANIKVAVDVSGTVKEAVMAFKEEKLVFSNQANTDGHW
jgi:predicted Fe-Mo cluster-binding NifX family protein